MERMSVCCRCRHLLIWLSSFGAWVPASLFPTQRLPARPVPNFQPPEVLFSAWVGIPSVGVRHKLGQAVQLLYKHRVIAHQQYRLVIDVHHVFAEHLFAADALGRDARAAHLVTQAIPATLKGLAGLYGFQ